MRGGILLVSGVLLSSCSGAEPEVRTPGSARSRQGLDEMAAFFHDEMTSGDPARVSALLISDEDLDAGFDAPTRLVLSEQTRSERRHVEAAAAEWGRFLGSQYRGFCARGAEVLEPGQRGVTASTEVVESLLVAGRFAGSDWAGWIREIVHTSGGFRMTKLPSDTPRPGHPELDLWACEVARRPGDPDGRGPR